MNIRKKQKSFTLLELLLASVIIATVLSVLLLEFITCAYLSESSRNLTRAITHAQYVMEEIKDTTFGSIASSVLDADGIGNKFCVDNETCNTGDAAYQDLWKGQHILKNETIVTTVDDDNPDLLKITVTVSWTDKSTRTSTTSLQTLIADPL